MAGDVAVRAEAAAVRGLVGAAGGDRKHVIDLCGGLSAHLALMVVAGKNLLSDVAPGACGPGSQGVRRAARPARRASAYEAGL